MVLLLPVPWWIMVLLQASYTCTNAACSNALPTSLQTPGVQLAYCLCRGGWCIWYRPHTRTQTQHAQTQCLPLCKHLVCSSPTACAVVDGGFGTGLIHAHKRSMLKHNAYSLQTPGVQLAYCLCRGGWWIWYRPHTHTNAACSNAMPTSLQTPGVQLAYCLCHGGWWIWYRPHTHTHTNAACSNTMPTLCKHLVCSSPAACAVVDGASGLAATGLVAGSRAPRWRGRPASSSQSGLLKCM